MVTRFPSIARAARTSAVLVATLLFLALSACGDDGSGFGTYVVKTGTVEARYEIPAALNDADVQEIERHRTTLKGAPPPYYVVAHVNNRRGADLFSAAQIQVLDSTGERVDVQPAGEMLRQWATNAGAEPLRDWFRIADEPRFSGFVKPGESAKVVLVLIRAEGRTIKSVTCCNGKRLVRV